MVLMQHSCGKVALEYSRLIYLLGTQVVKMASSLSCKDPLKSANKSRPLRFLCQRVIIFGFIIWNVKLLLLCIFICYNLFLVTNDAINMQPFFIGSPKTKERIKRTHLHTEQLQMLYKGLHATIFSHKIKRHQMSL